MSSSRTGTTPTRADAELLIDPISEFFAARERIAAILENPVQVRLAARFLSRCLVRNPLIANQPRAVAVRVVVGAVKGRTRGMAESNLPSCSRCMSLLLASRKTKWELLKLSGDTDTRSGGLVVLYL